MRPVLLHETQEVGAAFRAIVQDRNRDARTQRCGFRRAGRGEEEEEHQVKTRAPGTAAGGLHSNMTMDRAHYTQRHKKQPHQYKAAHALGGQMQAAEHRCHRLEAAAKLLRQLVPS